MLCERRIKNEFQSVFSFARDVRGDEGPGLLVINGHARRIAELVNSCFQNSSLSDRSLDKKQEVVPKYIAGTVLATLIGSHSLRATFLEKKGR